MKKKSKKDLKNIRKQFDSEVKQVSRNNKKREKKRNDKEAEKAKKGVQKDGSAFEADRENDKTIKKDQVLGKRRREIIEAKENRPKPSLAQNLHDKAKVDKKEGKKYVKRVKGKGKVKPDNRG